MMWYIFETEMKRDSDYDMKQAGSKKIQIQRQTQSQTQRQIQIQRLIKEQPTDLQQCDMFMERRWQDESEHAEYA